MTYKVDISAPLQISLNEADPIASILQNIAIILKTAQGSCPMFREFGLPQDHISMPVTVAKTMLISEIKLAVEQFEPRAMVLSVTFGEGSGSPSQLTPIVEVEINNEES